jgi:hypothetical protein
MARPLPVLGIQKYFNKDHWHNSETHFPRMGKNGVQIIFLCTSKAKKSNTSAKGCWESL